MPSCIKIYFMATSSINTIINSEIADMNFMTNCPLYLLYLLQKTIGICSILGGIRSLIRNWTRIRYPGSGSADPDPSALKWSGNTGINTILNTEIDYMNFMTNCALYLLNAENVSELCAGEVPLLLLRLPPVRLLTVLPHQKRTFPIIKQCYILILWM